MPIANSDRILRTRTTDYRRYKNASERLFAGNPVVAATGVVTPSDDIPDNAVTIGGAYVTIGGRYVTCNPTGFLSFLFLDGEALVLNGEFLVLPYQKVGNISYSITDTLVTLTLAEPTYGAEIWYTTDGSTPAKNGGTSALYSAPFGPLSEGVTVKAIAFSTSATQSDTLTFVYSTGVDTVPDFSAIFNQALND